MREIIDITQSQITHYTLQDFPIWKYIHIFVEKGKKKKKRINETENGERKLEEKKNNENKNNVEKT